MLKNLKTLFHYVMHMKYKMENIRNILMRMYEKYYVTFKSIFGYLVMHKLLKVNK